MGDLAKLPPAPARQVSGGLDQPLLQRMIEHAPVAIALIAGREYRFVYANPRYEAVAGVPAAVLLGRTVQDVTPGAAEAVAEACATGRMLKYHAQDLTAGNAGPAFWDVSYVPIPDADGTIDAVMMLALDVTEQRLAQRKAEQERVATEQAQRLLDGLMTYLPEGITIATPPDVTLLRVSAYGTICSGFPRRPSKACRWSSTSPCWTSSRPMG